MAIALTKKHKNLIGTCSKWANDRVSRGHWVTYRPMIFLPLSDGGYDAEIGVIIDYKFDSFKVLEEKGVVYIGIDLSNKPEVRSFGLEWGPGSFGIIDMLMDAYYGDDGDWEYDMSEKGRKKFIEDLAKEGLDIVGEDPYYKEIADTNTFKNFQKVYEKYASKTKAEMVLKVKKIHTLSNSKKLFPIMALDFNTDKVLWWGNNSKAKKGVMIEYEKSMFDLTEEDVSRTIYHVMDAYFASNCVLRCKAVCNGKEARDGEWVADFDMSY